MSGWMYPMCDGFPSLHDGVMPCIIILKQHFAQVLVRLNAFETLPHFFSVMTYTSELSFLSASHHGESLFNSPWTLLPSPFQLMENKELRCSYFSIPCSFCPAIYNAPVDCGITINIAEPFMDVPHLFCHCNRELTVWQWQHIVCNNYHWWIPLWRAAAEVSCVGNLCTFVHNMMEVKICTAWNNSFLALLLAGGKKNCGALLFGHPLYMCTIRGLLCHNDSSMWSKT
jgi:hypothetical protein